MGSIKKKSTIKIYLDMDGVIADFDGQIYDTFGKYPNEIEPRFMWRHIYSNELDFWANLPLCEGAQSLISFLKDNFEHLIIISSPGNGGYKTRKGKLEWLKNNGLGNYTAIFRKDKYIYADSNSLLIDDWAVNTDKWKENGGRVLEHKSSIQTIEQLMEILQEKS